MCTVVSVTKLLPDSHEIRYIQVVFMYKLLPCVSYYILTVYRPVGLLAVLPVRAGLVTGYRRIVIVNLLRMDAGF